MNATYNDASETRGLVRSVGAALPEQILHGVIHEIQRLNVATGNRDLDWETSLPFHDPLGIAATTFCELIRRECRTRLRVLGRLSLALRRSQRF